MTIRLIYESSPESKQSLTLGPRVAHDIKLRIRELESRLPKAITRADRRELHKLRTLLDLLRTGGDDA